MAKPQVYINVSQTVAVAGVIVLGLYYLRQTDPRRHREDEIKDRIRQNAGKVVNVIATPFRHYF